MTDVNTEELFVDAQLSALEILKTRRAEVAVRGAMVKLRIFIAQSHLKRTVRFTIKFPSVQAAEIFAQKIGEKYPSEVEPDPKEVQK